MTSFTRSQLPFGILAVVALVTIGVLVTQPSVDWILVSLNALVVLPAVLWSVRR